MDSQEEGSGFNGNWALKYMEEIAFPRRTGTLGEPKAAQTISRILKELGYETSEEDFYILLAPWIWIKGILLISLLLVFTKMGNESDGAVDNASGVGVLLEVSRNLVIHKPSVINPIFLFTGAEEMGLLGSLMFRKRHGEEMAQKEGLLINIDSVGKEGRMKGCSSTTLGKRWLRQVYKVAQEKGIRLQNLPFHRGILMDHLPFCSLGIPSISLSSISREGWHLHTQRDRFCLVQKEGLVEMGRLILGLIESLEIERRKNNGIKIKML
jgi:aminopeptidase-like protein